MMPKWKRTDMDMLKDVERVTKGHTSLLLSLLTHSPRRLDKTMRNLSLPIYIYILECLLLFVY